MRASIETRDGRCHEDVLRVPRPGPTAPWDPLDAAGRPLLPIPTPETKRPALASVYAITKYMQERLTLTLAPAYGMEGVALRLWNAYGPGQALSNPYTGVLAIFASRLHNGQPPMIFEDGAQRRDFVHVEDVAQAFVLALEHPAAAGGVFNIASGVDRTVEEVARLLAGAMGRGIWRPRSPARHVPATFATASPISAWRERPWLHAALRLRCGTDRTRRMGRDATGGGPRGPCQQ